MYWLCCQVCGSINILTKNIAAMMTKQIDKHKQFNMKIITSVSAMKEVRYYQSEKWIQDQITDAYTDYVTERLSTLKVRYRRGMFFRLNTALGITLFFCAGCIWYIQW